MYKSSIYPQYTNISTIFKTIDKKDSDGNVIGTQVVSFMKARKIAQDELNKSLAEQATQLITDKQCLLDYEQAVSKGTVSTEDFDRLMGKASVSAKEHALATKGAAGSTDVFVAKQEQAQIQLQATTKAAKIGKQALAALKSALVSFAVIKGIELIGKFFDNLIVTIEEQKEIVDESIASYKDAKNELETITSELENQTKAMDELLKKDELTYVEQGQLEELKEITKELELQQDIAKKKAESESKELAEESVDYIEKQYGGNASSILDIEKHMSDGDNAYDNQLELEGTVSSNIAAYRQYSALLEEDLKKPLEQQYENYRLYKDKAKEILLDMAEDLMSQKANIQDYYDTLKDVPYNELNKNQKKVVDTYKRIGNDIKLIYREIDPYTWNNMEINDIFKQENIEISKDALIKEVKRELDKIDYSSVGEDFNEASIVSDVLDSYPILYDAVKDSGMILLTEYSQIEEFQKEILALAKDVNDVIPEKDDFIFSDHEESIKSYKATMEAIGETIAKIRDESVGAEGIDINELMGMDEFKNIDQSFWDKMFDEGEVSEDVMKEVALDVWMKLYNSIKDLNGAEPIVQELKDNFEKASFGVSLEIAINENAYNNLVDILDRIRNNDTFDFDEITKYINTYGDEVAGALNKTGDAYTIEEEAIINLINKYGELTNSAIASEMAVLNASVLRIEALGGIESAQKKIKDIVTFAGNSAASLKHAEDISKDIENTNKYNEYLDSFKKIFDKLAELGSSSSSASIDWLTHSLSNLQEAVDDAQKTFDNADGIDAQREALIALNKELTNLQNTYYSLGDNSNTIYGEYERRYKEALGKLGKDSSSIKSKIEAGHVFNTQEFSSDVAKIVNEAIDAWNGMKDSHNKYLEIGVEIEGNFDKAFDSDFDNILNNFDNQLSHYENKAKLIEAQLANAETRGYIANKSYYQALQNVEVDTFKLLESNLANLNNLMANSNLDKNSDEWHQLQNEIEETSIAMQESANSIEELNNKMRQVDWDIFDFSRDQESKLMEEADFLIDLLDRADMFDDMGEITEEGLTTMGLHASNYNAYLEQSIKYAEELKKIEKDIANDSGDTELINRYDDLLERQREAILLAESEKDALIDLATEGVEVQKEALQELIDQYTKELETQQNIYELNKKNAEQTKKISSLRKQLIAYSSDTSEEGKARTQQIKAELETSMSDLESDQLDQYINSQKEILNSIQENYEQHLDAYLSDATKVISDSIDMVNKSNGVINNTIKEECKDVGYELSHEMEAVWNRENGVLSDGFNGVEENADANTGVLSSYAENMSTILQAMRDNMVGDVSNIDDNTSTIKTTLDNIYNTLNGISGKLNNKEGKQPLTEPQGNIGSSNKTNTSKNTNDTSTLSTGTTLHNVTGKWHEASDGTGNIGSVTTLGADSWKIDKVNEGSEYPYHIVGYKNGKFAGSGWVKKTQLGYKNGAKRIGEDQLAWTQENGTEYIIRPSDGAVLTPLAQGDSVLNAMASKNLWNMANNPNRFIMDNLNLRLPEFSRLSGNSSNNAEVNMNVEFVLPNATNYKEIMTEMQRDRKFEGFVKDVVASSMPNGNSLAKYKYKF